MLPRLNPAKTILAYLSWIEHVHEVSVMFELAPYLSIHGDGGAEWDQQ